MTERIVAPHEDRRDFARQPKRRDWTHGPMLVVTDVHMPTGPGRHARTPVIEAEFRSPGSEEITLEYEVLTMAAACVACERIIPEGESMWVALWKGQWCDGCIHRRTLLFTHRNLGEMSSFVDGFHGDLTVQLDAATTLNAKLNLALDALRNGTELE